MAEFAERLLTILNDAGLALMISIGHRTGLFDAMAGMPPSTSAEIAVRAGLNERYVREWLGSLATGGIVEYRPEQDPITDYRIAQRGTFSGESRT